MKIHDLIIYLFIHRCNPHQCLEQSLSVMLIKVIFRGHKNSCIVLTFAYSVVDLRFPVTPVTWMANSMRGGTRLKLSVIRQKFYQLSSLQGYAFIFELHLRCVQNSRLIDFLSTLKMLFHSLLNTLLSFFFIAKE